jgi:DNA mismatch endonuclease, patch repair protein
MLRGISVRCRGGAGSNEIHIMGSSGERHLADPASSPAPVRTVMDSAARSRIMRSIRKKDTKAELTVRSAVHALGYRFRLHRRDLPGSPDLILPRRRKVIFVHGCFWHQHPGCRKATVPRKRVDYWGPKLERNVARDARALVDLQALGWETLVLWECELPDDKALRSRLRAFIRRRSGSSRGRRPSLPCQSRDAPRAAHEVPGSALAPAPARAAAEARPARRGGQVRAGRRSSPG